MKKVKIKIQKSTLGNNHLHAVEKLLLCNKIRICDLPIKLRMSSKTYYIFALRVSRNISCSRYIEDLQLIVSDLSYTNKEKYLLHIKLLETYLSLSPFKGETEFEFFKKNISKKLSLRL